jgi:hypothetical protein
LRSELREREREVANAEMREGFVKQDLTRDVREREEQIKKSKDEIETSKLLEERAREESLLLRSEVAQLKGMIDEGDRSRDLLVRELAR